MTSNLSTVLVIYRFKDMINAVFEAVRTRTLYLHFNKEINYLENKDKNMMQKATKFLKGIVSENRYIDLLRAVKKNTDTN